jgi:hypothetical protein
MKLQLGALCWRFRELKERGVGLRHLISCCLNTAIGAEAAMEVGMSALSLLADIFSGLEMVHFPV